MFTFKTLMVAVTLVLIASAAKATPATCPCWEGDTALAVSNDLQSEFTEVGAREVGEREVSIQGVGEREVSIREVGEREVSIQEVGEREVGIQEVGEREVGVRIETVETLTQNAAANARSSQLELAFHARFPGLAPDIHLGLMRLSHNWGSRCSRKYPTC